MSQKGITFKCFEKEIILTHFAKESLIRYRQLSSSSPERGGLVFGQILTKDSAVIRFIREVTTKEAKPRFCLFSKNDENKIIKEEFKKGNHLLGKWHTHYENTPEPSAMDIASMQTYYATSEHNMPFFLMLIIGKDESIYMGGFNDKEYRFEEICC